MKVMIYDKEWFLHVFDGVATLGSGARLSTASFKRARFLIDTDPIFGELKAFIRDCEYSPNVPLAVMLQVINKANRVYHWS